MREDFAQNMDAHSKLPLFFFLQVARGLLFFFSFFGVNNRIRCHTLPPDKIISPFLVHSAFTVRIQNGQLHRPWLIGSPPIKFKMTVSLRQAFLVLLVVRQSIVARVNLILGTYSKGAVGKKGDKILAGCAVLSWHLPNCCWMKDKNMNC